MQILTDSSKWFSMLKNSTEASMQKDTEKTSEQSEKKAGKKVRETVASGIKAVTKHDCYLAAGLQKPMFLYASLPLILKGSPPFSIFCFLTGSENGRCVASEYFTEPEIEITTENTANILSE